MIEHNKKILNYKRTIARQRKIIAGLLDEIDYLLSPMRLLDITDLLTKHYSVLLFPPAIKVAASDNHTSEEYKIKANEVICIISNPKQSKVKHIYLQKKIKNLKDESKLSNCVKVNNENTIPEIAEAIDTAKIHLAQVSQSAYVNLAFYEFVKDEVVLKLKGNKVKIIQNITISKKYIAGFQSKKQDLEKIKIFHKIDISSIIDF